jgi:aspartate aminotransferase
MGEAFQTRRDVVVDGLNRIEGVSCRTPKGAFYVFPNIAGMCAKLGATEAYDAMDPELQAHTSPSTLVQLFLLYSYQVATMDRQSFGRLGAHGKHYLRLSIATGLEDLEEAVRRIGLAAHDRDGFESFLTSGRTHY